MSARLHALLATSLLFVVPAALPAQNLFTNGSFEDADLTGWNLAGSTCLDAVEFSGFAIDGDYEFIAGPVDNSCTLSQEVSTTPGESYLFSFWLDNSFEGPNSFSAQWGGSTLLDLSNFAEFGYQQYSYSVLATSATTTVAFTFQHTDGLWFVDDVRAEATDVVPEPATMTLLATGLVGMAAARRRRKGAR